MTEMRKKHSLFLVSLSILAAVSGCRVAEEDHSPEKTPVSETEYPVHFIAEEIETRTAFGEAESDGTTTTYPTLWTENDSKVAVSLNLSGVKAADVNPSEDFRMATFDADFAQSEVSAPYVFYALSPFSAYVGASSSHGGFHFNILTEQTPLAFSCDEGAQVMAASKEVGSIADFSGVDLYFSHLTAYGKMTLTHVGESLPDGAEIQSIELTASVPFAGQFYYNFAENSLLESAPSRTVSLKPDNLTWDENGNSEAIWFACAPADLGGGSIKVDVNTSAGVLSRTVTIPEGKLAFERGRVSKFTVNMASASFTQTADRWVLVKDATTLAAGDEIIIANAATEGSAFAVSTAQNSNNRGQVSVTIAQDADGQTVVRNPGASVEVLKLVDGYYDGYYYLQEASSSTGRYLYTTNNSNNYLRSEVPGTASNSNNRDFSNWKITTNASYAAFISTKGTYQSYLIFSYYKQIRYNTSSSIFSAYGSSSQNAWNSSTSGTTEVYIYRRQTGINPDADPILAQEQFGAYLTGGNRVFGAGDQLSREYRGDATVTFSILKPSARQVAEFNGIPISPAKGDTFTLNYNQISGRTRSDRDYEVTVAKVDGPKVWLTTGTGEGFIVKK